MGAQAEVTVTDERKVKSYGLFGMLQFIEKNYPKDVQAEILDSVPQEVRDFIAGGPEQLWVPPLYPASVWQAMIKREASDDAAYDTLVRCGRNMGEYATNTYLRLLLKVISMKMLAKKYPTIWRMDANFGDMSTDTSDIKQGKLKIFLNNLESYPYFGPICVGWFKYSMDAMGLKDVKVELHDWTMAEPDPGKLTFHVTWTP